MAAPHPRLLLGDSSDCVYSANILDVLVELVVCVREVGSLYRDVGDLKRRRAETDERSTAIRADLQRFARQAEVGLRATAGDSHWGEVHQHAEKAIGSLHTSVKRWQRYYNKSTEREQRKLRRRIGALEEILLERLGRFLIARRAEWPVRTLDRSLELKAYRDVLEVELFSGIRARFALGMHPGMAPKRVKQFARGVEIQLGMRKPFLRDVQPNRVPLDELHLMSTTIGPGGAELLLARKPTGEEPVRLSLGLQHGVVTALGKQGDGEEFEVPPEDRPALTVLWRGLQSEVAAAAQEEAKLLELHLDRDRVFEADDVFATLERIVEYYRPIVTDLATHSPNAEELSIKIEVEQGHREEVFVYRADLAQHILALPPGVRERVRIKELVGSDADYVSESDCIDLGAIVHPDAGADSDIIALTYPLTAAEEISGPIVELVADDVQLIEDDDSFTDEEISACFDLAGVVQRAESRPLQSSPP